ncbi:GH92 family glycosyl hydrolase [Rhizosphaericola mali]|uniref:Glycoside hydrolase family 92 protein n=1 Tax=Rhizosphaericola mali TaxID=2545455 RepID=A0A5P2FY36_9BACT|nr:GH92 family glycosyl hydrolase [Rhizosphaericola mali]QES88406.1 glycoside hydrolase family 92 protein [Rhizosphaericola mali]
MYFKSFLSSTLVFLGTTLHAQTTTTKTSFVDPRIGSDGHGHVFVGADVPFGAVQLGPTQINKGWDWCSGYNYAGKEILGFSHTHLSGTGCADLNDILLVPANGKQQLFPMKENDPESGYGSYFSRNSEHVSPGYYQVYLDKYKVNVELTSTERVGLHKYHYENKTSANIFVDLGFHQYDDPKKTFFKKVNDSTFVGYRLASGWANDKRVYFAIKLSQPSQSVKLFDGSNPVAGNEAQGKEVKAALYFNAEKNADIEVKVAISPVSEENALLNMKVEMPSWNFDLYKNAADQKWNETLSRIDFDAPQKEKTIFYTAMYHMYIAPSLFNDVNNDYRGTDKKVYKNADFKNVTTLSLWDSYRAWAPFMTIAEPEKVQDMVSSMLAIFQQQGRLPVWPLMGCETDCMVGNPAIPVITDAYLKGLIPRDKIALAYEAVRSTAMRQKSGLNYVQKLQFIPMDSLGQSVSWALEFAIADAGIARMAKSLGKVEDAKYFKERSELYHKYWDASRGFFIGRKLDGSFREPFNPISPRHDYTEGDAWQYIWSVPQDVKGLISLVGGEKTFEDRLDHFFHMSSELGDGAPPDISGMIGQYAQGNEPSHHIIYLYNYLGRPDKTADLLRASVDSFYTDKPDGLCGNEDVGQMSAWYAFTAMGMYPVDPTSGRYVFGTPLANDITIHISKNTTFNVKVVNNNMKNKYIQKVLWNGKDYPKMYIDHSTIVKGGTLTFVMGDKPSNSYGKSIASRPN